MGVSDKWDTLVWVSDGTGSCTWFNEDWLEFRGRTMEQEIGTGWLEGVHPDDRENVMEDYMHAFQRRLEFVLKYRLMDAKGKYHTVIDAGTPHFDRHAFLGYRGVCSVLADRPPGLSYFCFNEPVER